MPLMQLMSVRSNSLSDGLDPPSQPASSAVMEIMAVVQRSAKFCFVSGRKLLDLTTA